MILFVTDYDPATEANRLMANLLIGNFETTLLGANATREALHATLEGNEKALYAMSHGRPGHLMDQDRNPAIGIDDIPLLYGHPTFAFACHTATMLGREVATAGGVWWGYTGPIPAPPNDADQQVLLKPLFDLLITFAGHTTRELVIQFLEILKTRCDEVAEQIGPDGNVLDLHYCVYQIWDKLRVWLPAEQDAMHHPAATRGYIFD